MPKKPNRPAWGGRGRPNHPNDKHYFGHDDRTSRPHDGPEPLAYNKNKPRVTFNRRICRQKPGPLSKGSRHPHALDDDVMMAAGPNNNGRIMRPMRGRGKSFMRGRNSPLPHGPMRDGNFRQLPISETNWYRVIIPKGQKYTKEFVLGNLQSYVAPFTFNPILFKVEGEDVTFFVEEHKSALKLADCDKKITTNDGFKMLVKVRPSGPPPFAISDELKERLKQAMGKRYSAASNALDLSKFHLDPELAVDYWCPLGRPTMLVAVLDLVAEHIPHLEALNLDSNKIANVERLSLLASKFEKLKILHIGDNKIKEMGYLSALKNSRIEELRLEGNPVCNKYKTRNDEYISDLRKYFPKLLKLDNVELPPPIVFDLEDSKSKLPPTQRMFVVQSNEKAQNIASQFLQQYFMVFDAESRQLLLSAYHEHASFSLTATVASSSSKLCQYLHENRNLCRINDPIRRRKLLKQGRLPVVSFLSEMPRTKHDLSSFTMDLSLVTEGMMVITVTGLFKELSKDNKDVIRYFDRTFIIVPEGTGFCISNEQLHITSPTSAQEKQFNHAVQIAQPTPGPSAAPLSEEVKQQMTLTLSQETNMNIEWSLKCLEEVNWNYDNARAAFQEAFSSGKIPPHAFTK
ncbi:hypothetical protein QAD02_008510 [Eretmocerus hayati]|uniref:Uncharacterized protein n=1 Tax=Eretmocerus hayati TaxID=131215 RepID=A0ACC2N6S2_9HYME|nr:hypothetical protein QAD02_008510 [Eretmocerus hayati]